MQTLPPFIVSRVNHGMRCGLLNRASSAAHVLNVIGHRQYVLAILRLLRRAGA